jgi:hypothetical protein
VECAAARRCLLHGYFLCLHSKAHGVARITDSPPSESSPSHSSPEKVGKSSTRPQRSFGVGHSSHNFWKPGIGPRSDAALIFPFRNSDISRMRARINVERLTICEARSRLVSTIESAGMLLRGTIYLSNGDAPKFFGSAQR